MESKRVWNTLNQALCEFLFPCIYMRKRKYDKNLSSVIKNVHEAHNKLILNNVHEHVLYASFLLLLKIEPTYQKFGFRLYVFILFWFTIVGIWCTCKLSDFIILVFIYLFSKRKQILKIIWNFNWCNWCSYLCIITAK